MKKWVRHFEHFFDAMKPAIQNDEEAFVWLSGLQHPMYNVVTHLSCSSEALGKKLDHLIQKLPASHSFWAQIEELATALKERGYKLIVTCPVMVWDVVPVLVPKFDVRLAEDMTSFYDILSTTSEFDKITGEGMARLLNHANAEHYLAYLDGTPVGIGTLFVDGKVGVVSNVATLAEYQRKGCGKALMLTLMNRSHDLGLEQLILGTSKAAEKLYNHLGFQELFKIEMYTH